MDPSISFHNHSSVRSDKRNDMLKALAGSSWGHDKETLPMTYNALGKSIANYAAPVWSINASDSSFKKIQTAQNAALRKATGAHKMASIDHLHQETIKLRVKDHSDMLSAQYLVNCLEEDDVSHGITIQEPRPRPMKETLHSRHHSAVLPRLGKLPESAHTCGRFCNSTPRTQQSIEEASTHNIGRGAETTMHSLTTTVRTLPSITLL